MSSPATSEGLLKRLIVQITHYLSAGAITAALAYGTVAVLTRVLSPQEYGVFTVFQAIVNFVAAVAALNFQVAAGRYYLEENADTASFTKSTVVFLLFTNAAVVAATYAWRVPVGQWVGLEGSVLFAAVIVASLRVPWLMVWKILVAQMRSRTVTLLSGSRDLSLFFATVVFALWASRNTIQLTPLHAAMAGVFVASIAVALPALLWLHREGSKGRVRRTHLRYALHFGLPLIPSTVAITVLNLLDRVVILDALGPVQTGVYAFAYNIGQVMSLAVMASAQAIGPVFTRLRDQHDEAAIEKAWQRINLPLVALSILLVLFSPEVAFFLGDARYQVGLSVVPWVALAYLARAYAALFAQYAIYLKQTWLNGIGIVIAAVANGVLNVLLVPKYGIQAAAFTTFGSFVFLLFWNAVTAKVVLKEKLVRTRIWLPWLLFATLLLPVLDHVIRLYCSTPLLTFGIKSSVVICVGLAFFLHWQRAKKQ